MKSLAIVIANQSNKFVTHSTAILHINCQRKKGVITNGIL